MTHGHELSQLLDELVGKAFKTSFPDCEPRRAGKVGGAGIIAVLGFSGPNIRGALGLAGTREALEATHPVDSEGAEHDRSQLEDWVGELANRVLGSLKGGLWSRGISMHLATPVILRGVSVEVLGQDDIHSYAIEHPSGRFEAWIDLKCSTDLALEGDAANEAVASAGAAIVF